MKMKKLLALLTPKLVKKYAKNLILEWLLGKFNIHLYVDNKPYIAMDLWEMYSIVKYDSSNNKFELVVKDVQLTVDFEGVFNDE